jgi:hypothetical protein
MRAIQTTLAWLVSVAGLLMPWRARILFSELLGWIAQLVPPQLYQLDAMDEQQPSDEDGGSGVPEER